MSVYGPYRARITSVHDGDTCSMVVDLGFGLVLEPTDFDGNPRMSCRVFGINAPELGTAEGKAALAYAETLLPVGTEVSIVSHGWDKYGGRFDASIQLPDGRDFGTLMIDAGHAVAYP